MKAAKKTTFLKTFFRRRSSDCQARGGGALPLKKNLFNLLKDGFSQNTSHVIILEKN